MLHKQKNVLIVLLRSILNFSLDLKLTLYSSIKQLSGLCRIDCQWIILETYSINVFDNILASVLLRCLVVTVLLTILLSFALLLTVLLTVLNSSLLFAIDSVISIIDLKGSFTLE